MLCKTAANEAKSRLPDLIAQSANAMIIKRTEMCINTRYFIPALKTSFFSLSKITRKNEESDIISQQIKNIKAFWQVTTRIIEMINPAKNTMCAPIVLPFSRYGFR